MNVETNSISIDDLSFDCKTPTISFKIGVHHVFPGGKHIFIEAPKNLKDVDRFLNENREALMECIDYY